MSREMKKPLLFFIAVLMAVQGTAFAVSINPPKKASSVKKQETSVKDMGASLVPTIMGFVSSVQEVSKKQKDLTEECKPTSQEIQWVNNMIKEWAKTGSATPDEIKSRLGMEPCPTPEGGYEQNIRLAADIDDDTLRCYDWFGGDANKSNVWYRFPMAKLAYYCTDGSLDACAEKNRKYVSNIYDVFNLIDFTQEDYSLEDAKLMEALGAKIEKCSYAKLDAKKKAIWGEFLVNTIGNVGQKTNTGTIMQSVSGIASSGGLGGLSSLGGIASQFLNK